MLDRAKFVLEEAHKDTKQQCSFSLLVGTGSGSAEKTTIAISVKSAVIITSTVPIPRFLGRNRTAVTPSTAKASWA